MNAKDHIKLLIATGMAALSMVTLLSVCGCIIQQRQQLLREGTGTRCFNSRLYKHGYLLGQSTEIENPFLPRTTREGTECPKGFSSSPSLVACQQ